MINHEGHEETRRFNFFLFEFFVSFVVEKNLLKNNPQGHGMVFSGILCGFYGTADARRLTQMINHEGHEEHEGLIFSLRALRELRGGKKLVKK